MPPCSTSGDDVTPGLMGKTKYPASEAKKLLTRVSHLGLGTMHAEHHERLTAKGPVLSKTSTKFRKRKFSELEPTAQAILKHLRVSQEDYGQTIDTAEGVEESATPLGDITNN